MTVFTIVEKGEELRFACNTCKTVFDANMMEETGPVKTSFGSSRTTMWGSEVRSAYCPKCGKICLTIGPIPG